MSAAITSNKLGMNVFTAPGNCEEDSSKMIQWGCLEVRDLAVIVNAERFSIATHVSDCTCRHNRRVQ
jgi:hypothetical protein